jgi:hypothetical protein
MPRRRTVDNDLRPLLKITGAMGIAAIVLCKSAGISNEQVMLVGIPLAVFIAFGCYVGYEEYQAYAARQALLNRIKGGLLPKPSSQLAGSFDQSSRAYSKLQ